MLQIVQHLRSGKILTEEMPVPQCPHNGVLIEVKNSLISAGTERTLVENAKGNLLAKAKKQPEQVQLVLDAVKNYGIKETTRRVSAKLDSHKPLGYSASGVVRESRCDDFRPGDRVAAAGAGSATHSEFIAVPRNLVVKLPDEVSFEDAAYTTVGSIAMQGVRRAEPTLGENIVVVGLGLVGLLTVQLLKAAGCYVIGMDIDERTLRLGEEFGCDLTLKSSSESIESVLSNCNGYGADATILTASTPSDKPLQMAMEMTRKKGKVVVVGAIGLGLKRNPFYKKEIDLRISSSYGPGRYDAFYEEVGNDYPYAYVRWTENRNMQAFLDLIASGKVNVSKITTHDFDVQEASRAYALLTEGSEEHLGILLNYPDREQKFTTLVRAGKPGVQKDIIIGFLGAGQFAQNYLLPPLSKEDVTLKAVVNATSTSSKAVPFDFEWAGTGPDEVLGREDINTIFIASRPDSHAEFVIKALENNKHVYVEKPLAVNKEQLEQVKQAYEQAGDRQLMVGFNRRFSRSFETIREFFSGRKEPMIVKYRVNAGHVPAERWIHRIREGGGGRIISEACHFIDIMLFLIGSKPVRVHAESLSGNAEAKPNEDNIVATLKFSDGSMGVLEYFSNGDKSLGKEYCEVYCGNTALVMDDFKEVRVHRNGRASSKKMDTDKGIGKEMKEYVRALRTGDPLIIFEDLYLTTLITFNILDSLETGKPVEIGEQVQA